MATTITMGPSGLQVPDDPIIPFIEGDGTGPDIWAAAVRVLEAAVDKAYGGDRVSPGRKSWPAKRPTTRRLLASRRDRRRIPSVTWSESRAR